ncbi:MAG TPA: hypothetical protein VJT49_10695 [Amycolatopsis sp.]|uniref:hypothetical protein n=1 Tax=Amycolatopsis sp. TaxID=37632 RepID=UPI002B48FD77|nr:hypothetical protein [Amycolatopsis sp.]HKS45562.1 hypothetical protein [Amycolatopsis sp.]
MDERELGTLFRAAPGDPPPSTFTLEDVTAASARATARRRSTLIMTLSCVVVVLVGFGLFRWGPSTGTNTTSGSAQVITGGQPAQAPERLPNASTPSPLQGSDGTGEAGPRAEGTTGCDKVDRELAIALAGELPVTGASGPSPGRVCTTGSRSAGFQVTDGDRKGFLSVTLLPAGVAVPVEPGAMTAQELAASGATLVISSTPDPGGAPPFQTDLQRVAVALAARF